MSRTASIESADAEQWLELCPDRVLENWKAAYAVEPFGGEQQLLARIASLLYLIAAKGRDFEKICKASDAIMKCLMPGEWIGQSETSKASIPNIDEIKQNLRAMQQMAEKVFG